MFNYILANIINIKFKKMAKKTLTVTIDEELKEKAKREAEKDNRTLSSYINNLLSEFFKKKEEDLKPNKTTKH